MSLDSFSILPNKDPLIAFSNFVIYLSSTGIPFPLTKSPISAPSEKAVWGTAILAWINPAAAGST